ncbi:FliM/FliN family flagellar motor switch protein [Shewanella sp. A25]|nr:FliM/FliN family flagellar motor switch protein [Shewanella shenzhenensis]
MTDNLDAALAELGAFGLDDFEDEVTSSGNTDKSHGMGFFSEVPLTVTLEVASAQLTLGELSKVRDGDVLPLDKMAGEPLDVMVNGVAFAKAEVVIVDGRYGIRFLPKDSAEDSSAEA